MAVAAASKIVNVGDKVQNLWFSSTHPPVLDKGSASTIAAVLGLDDEVCSCDMGASVRSVVGCLKAAFLIRESTLLVTSDTRFGRPGSDDEINGSDGSAAFIFGSAPKIILIDLVSESSPVMDRWRGEGEVGTQSWDDRWAVDQQVPLMIRAGMRILEKSALSVADIAHVVISAPSPKVVSQVGAKFNGVSSSSSDWNGYLGSADLGIKLVSVLSAAKSNSFILLISGADGADAMLLKTTELFRPDQHVEPLKSLDIDVITYLSWRGLVHREPPRRPDSEVPSAPAVARSRDWKFSFAGSMCTECGSRHLPPQRICMSCGATDKSTSVVMQKEFGVVRTFTVDHIALSLSPPVVIAVVDFDSGGRYRCQLTDVSPEDTKIGMRVEMTYRLISKSSNGVRNYFWKARPTMEGNQ